MNDNREFGFEIKEHIGVIAQYSSGWTKEVNLVSWNGGQPKIDIRDWDADHEHMSKGITLTEQDAGKLARMLTDRTLSRPANGRYGEDLER